MIATGVGVTKQLSGMTVGVQRFVWLPPGSWLGFGSFCGAPPPKIQPETLPAPPKIIVTTNTKIAIKPMIGANSMTAPQPIDLPVLPRLDIIS